MKRMSLALLALWIATPQPAIADETFDPAGEQVLTPAEQEMLAAHPEGEVAPERMALSLAEAVAMGIENNLGLQVQRFDPLIAFEDQEKSWGSFDPLAKVGFAYTSATEPVSGSSLLGDERDRRKFQTTDIGVSTLLPYVGATVGIDLGLERTSEIARFTSQRPLWDSGIAVQGNLPLLKGLIWNQPWTRVKTNESAYRGSRQNFRTDLMDTVQFIEVNYWNLVAQTQAVLVARKSLETARSLLDQTQTQYDVGVKSKVEVVEAEAGVAAREFDLIRAVNTYRRAQDNLIDAVLGVHLTAASGLEIDPLDDPENYIAYQIDTQEAALKALSSRPELAEAKSLIEQSEYQLKFAKNQRLPQLDLQASYGVGGRRGEGAFGSGRFDPSQPVSIANAPRTKGPTTGHNYGDTFDDYWTDSGGEDLRLGFLFSVPLGLIEGRHGVSMSELQLRRAKTGLTRLRQNIILEVRDGARNLQSAQEGILAAERRRLAAEEQLRAEKVRLEYGESTPFKVLEKEEDLVSAENQKIGALFTYRKSVVDLHRAQGTILETRNIVVDDAAALR